MLADGLVVGGRAGLSRFRWPEVRLLKQIVMLEEAAGAAGVTLTVENDAILITPPP